MIPLNRFLVFVVTAFLASLTPLRYIEPNYIKSKSIQQRSTEPRSIQQTANIRSVSGHLANKLLSSGYMQRPLASGMMLN